MIIQSEKTEKLKGSITIPASKSHTIRAVVFASLAKGRSKIINPLHSSDGLSSVECCRKLGADIEMHDDHWIVHGFDGKPKTPEDIIDVGNSGTSLRLCTGVASLCEGTTVFTGDDSIRSRPMQPILDALNNLGADCRSTHGNGKAPITVKGSIKGGFTEIDGTTSQYLSSLLTCCAFAKEDSRIIPVNLNEKPYVEMTLSWLDWLGIKYRRDGYDEFLIKGGQTIKGFERQVPGDFSSATFPLCAAAMIDSDVKLYGLDMNDTQGDRKVIDYLVKMGAKITIKDDFIHIKGGNLKGAEFDLNDTPDALPAMCVAGCTASGVTRLINVPQARIKETDRISVMAKELSKMGAEVKELPDGIEIHNSYLKGAKVKSHDDHRIAMAMSLAGMIAEGKTEIHDSECISVTFPNFIELMQEIGCNIRGSLI